MNNRNLHALYGIKWNPFGSDVPVHALKIPQHGDRFIWQVEQLAFDGGFAMLSGASGSGKSTLMRVLLKKISAVGGISTAHIDRPQSSLRDFYIELGAAFGMSFKMSNRFGGFKRLREEWLKQIAAASFRPFLFIDEAQALPTEVLSEIRILGSHDFDSRCILAVVLAGDPRLPARLRENEELVPLDTRIRARMLVEKYSCEDLIALLNHAVTQAGAPELMAPGIKPILAELANGSPRALMNYARDLLTFAAEKESRCIDEQVLFEFDNSLAKQRVKLPRQNSRGG